MLTLALLLLAGMVVCTMVGAVAITVTMTKALLLAVVVGAVAGAVAYDMAQQDLAAGRRP